MNKLNIFTGNNTELLYKKSILELNNYLEDFSKQNIIIVPDRLSLITEQKIFEILNTEVYFNLSVMGISKFANKIINENGLNILECSAFQSKLLTLMAIQNVKRNFECFSKNYTLGFVDEIYSKIEQIKSSNANIDELIDENASKGTILKYNDLRLIYNQYEKLRGSKLDSGSLLSFFNNICGTSTFLKNCNVFFIGFDSLTKQGIQVLANVANNANHCSISILSPENQANSNIYDTSFLDSVLNACSFQNIKYTITKIDCTLDNRDKNLIQTNIFSRKNKFDSNNYFDIYSAPTTTDEIDFAVKSINYNLKRKKYKFNDIAICCPVKDMEIIKSKLNALNISAYTDERIALSSTEPVKFIISFIKSAIEPYNKNHIVEFISNDFCGLDIKTKHILINLINQFSSLNAIKKYNKDTPEEIILFIDKYFGEINNFTENNDYINNLYKFISNNGIFEKITNLNNNFKNLNQIALEKTYLQIENKFTSVLKEMEQALGTDQLTINEFSELLFKALDESEINGIPSTTNQVFIGDIKSFYSDVKLLYIIETNNDVFPPFLVDTGLITDKEITSDSIKAKLEPTTKIINKRNKYKALDVLLSANEKCYICYHKASSDGKTEQPSEFINELCYLFSKKEIDVSSLVNIDEDNIESLCFNTADIYNANLALHSENFNKIIKSSLIKCNALYVKPEISELPVDFKTLFLKNNKTSISLVEKYNSCPKAAFLSNGICLKQNKKDKIEANIIGSFIHEVAELFIKQNFTSLGNLNEDYINTTVINICETLKNKENYYSIYLDKNKFIYNLIKNECINFCSFINFEQTISDFKPAYTEKYFGDNSSFKPITLTVDNVEYRISGIVDRIDYSEDYFRIIDYKSGNPNFKNLKNGLFYGTKLQLFIYAQAINQNVNKNFFGAFYLPVQNKFEKNEQDSLYKYIGFILNSVPLAQKCDKNFNADTKESKYFDFKLNKPTKSGELIFRKNDNILTEEELLAFNKYAIGIISNTIKNLKNGYIECSPIDKKCDHCEFLQICKHANEKSKTRSQNYTLTNQVFLELNYE